MARGLGGEFAMTTPWCMPEDRIAGLDGDLAVLADDGYKVTTTPTTGRRWALARLVAIPDRGRGGRP